MPGRDDVLVTGHPALVAARPGQPVVGGQELLHLSRHLHARVDQHDQVVAGPLQVGDQMRRQQDAELGGRRGLHEALEELAPGQRVERGHRLVEDQQLRPFGQPDREGELGALAAGELAGPLRGIQAELGDPFPRPGRRPSRG